MGCSSSKPEEMDYEAPRIPVQPSEAAHNTQRTSADTRSNVPQESSDGRQNSAAHVSSRPGDQSDMMDPDIRKEFLRTIHASLHDVPYTVIGGSALAEHGSSRETADMDVLVGEGISKGSAEQLLVRRSQGRIVRLGQGRLGYIATNGKTYQLDLTADEDVDLPFDVNRDTQVIKGARVATMVFLLNSKAHAWQTRVPFERGYREKRQKDAQDIAFCLQALVGSRNIDRSRLNWIYSRYFWVPFREENPQFEILFREAGLWTDQAEFSSGSSMSGRSSRSNWSAPGSFTSRPGTLGSRQGSMNSNNSRGSNWSARGGAIAVH